MFYFKLFANFCLLILANHAVQSQTLHEEHQFGSMFHEFIQTHKRDYKTQAEHKNRFNIFVQNMKKADALQKSQLGTATYGVTQFSDFTEAEFKQRYSGLNNRLGSLNSFPTAKIPNLKLPKHFDWRKKHVISEVKNQGLCSSCWAFSTTGNIESQWAIKHKKVLSLSEQELIDCDTGSSGCSGGLMTQAYETIIRLGGLEKEINYPYAEVNGSRCEFNKSKVVVKISGAVIIPSNELQMAKWLVKHGPINIGLNFADMQLYQKGIAHPNSTFCNHENLNHAVLLVGFGVQNKIPYWIAKNSWGSKWGEKGYYRIYRGDNTCGLNQMASSAVL